MNPLTPLKLHLFIGLFVLNIIGNFLDTPPPYYPIELSRIAASGSISLSYFRFLILSLIIHFFIVELKTWSIILIWVSLLLIVSFDDVNYWGMHMLGVFLLIVSVTLYGIETWNMPSSVNNAFLIGTVIILWFVRTGMKVLVIYFFELGPDRGLADIATIAQDIMYRGSDACINPETTIIVFKLGGVIQWTCFWLMSEMIRI